jgi:glycine/D-amino acid oxidase-like deaminating enzyme
VNTYDVVVIGAGVIGSSVAFQLAKLGAKNVLVLARLGPEQRRNHLAFCAPITR